jgi:hypothetical protein
MSGRHPRYRGSCVKHDVVNVLKASGTAALRVPLSGGISRTLLLAQSARRADGQGRSPRPTCHRVAVFCGGSW